jgi:uncharacterized Zn finger protein (UPF0148 family)
MADQLNLILEAIEKMKSELKADIADVKDEIRQARNELKSDILGLKAEMYGVKQYTKRIDKIEARQAVAADKIESIEADVSILQGKLAD